MKTVLNCQYVLNGTIKLSEELDVCLVEGAHKYKPGDDKPSDSDIIYLTQGNGGQEFTLTRDQAASLARKLSAYVLQLDTRDGVQ